MSTWTLKEVRALSEKHGGGNKACIAKWLSHGDVEKYRPHPGDSLDKYKNFIRLAYEEKMFMAKDDAEEEPAEEAEEQAEEAPAAAAPARRRHGAFPSGGGAVCLLSAGRRPADRVLPAAGGRPPVAGWRRLLAAAHRRADQCPDREKPCQSNRYGVR